SGIVWAFTSSYAANWIPLTWISHMADVSLSGLDSGRHHVTSFLLHAFSTLLLFSALRRMTGARWRSAFVALLFALHPLHVQSGAWAANRRDPRSAGSWVLALGAFARYPDRPGTRRYVLVMVAYCAALLAKPMAVTFPFVLVLLDLWPLRRFSSLLQGLRD